jgi:glycosyltransferase involved in cell wall biosynthesis
MKVLLISTSDIKGGACRATYRLHQGLKSIEVNSQMLVKVKHSDDQTVMGTRDVSGIGQSVNGLRLTLDRLPLKFYSHGNKTTFSPHWIPNNINSQVFNFAPDIINLHFVSAGYLQIETIAKFNHPIVWTLHDMWSFTGGCHYNQECDRYISSCGACPQLGSERDWDLSRWIWKRKANAWKNISLTIVTPSVWLAKCAKESSLFRDRRVEVIPYGIDLNLYRPINKKVARELLKLPQDKQLILFLSLRATSDKRKGFHLLQPALKQLSQTGWQEKLEIMVVGASQSEKSPELGLKSHYLGTLNDSLTLALAYSAADVFVAPSVQDNLPNTVLEAISCGTPCVAFNIGGMPDMIEHQKNGYLAEPYKIEDLVRGVVWTLENQERYQKLSHRAREKAEQEFALEIQARRYESLFSEILEKSFTTKELGL